ncbi:MAG: Eco57I restriction-modification methylase domain-containing protein, partial [Anaerolineae bacterium]
MDMARARELLQACDLRRLFVDELGWDHHDAPLQVTVRDATYCLQGIAHKRGLVAYHCPVPTGAELPPYPLRRQIERQVARAVHEHLIIFTDAGGAMQVWQWVKREPGRPLACREHPYYRGQTGEALLQKLQALAFALQEEEDLTLPEVLRRVRSGLDVERVTKRFYDQFKKEHAAFLQQIEGIGEGADRAWYASVMLNRLMFIYFIQRKGFLDGDRDYLRSRLGQVQRERGPGQFYTFYRYFLRRLFHEGLGGSERPPELEQLLGCIPYLNGGLFEVHAIEARYPEIDIPDDAFARLFDYFDRYQWHLDERPLRRDDEINPDVLGYIFEKYINQKEMGAYYTKEDITEYIAKNTIVPFLLDAARRGCRVAFENPDGPTVWDLLRDDPDRYLYPAVKHGVVNGDGSIVPETALPDFVQAGMHDPRARMFERRYNLEQAAADDPLRLPTETWREYVERRRHCLETRARLSRGEVRDPDDLITLNLDIRQFAQDAIEAADSAELLRAFWQPLAGTPSKPALSVLDPTCGSGAFLFAALNILEPLYEACLERMQGLVEALDHGPQKHRPEKLADLRAVLERVKLHPNRRYYILKSIILNNLYGVDIMAEAVEICKLRLYLKLAAQVEPDPGKPNLGIEALPDIDFNIRCGNTLVGYATWAQVEQALTGRMDFEGAGPRIRMQAEELQQLAEAFRRQQIEGDASVPAAHKQELQQRLDALHGELDRYLASEYEVDVEDGEAYTRWRNSHQPFHWFVHYYGI